MINFLLYCFCFISLSDILFASPLDVKPKNIKHGDAYLKIEHPESDLVHFEKCLWKIENSCQPIGKNFYTIEELISQRNTENWQIIGAAVGFTGVAGSSLIITGGILGSLSSYIVIGTGDIALGSLISSIITPTVLANFTNLINPIEQFRQASVLNTEVIEDKEVIVSNIYAFINRLELILTKI